MDNNGKKSKVTKKKKLCKKKTLIKRIKAPFKRIHLPIKQIKPLDEEETAIRNLLLCSNDIQYDNW